MHHRAVIPQSLVGYWDHVFLKMPWPCSWLSVVDEDLESFTRSGESRCISLLYPPVAGGHTGGQVLVCKVCNWSAVASEAARDMSKASSFSYPPSLACWEWAPSTQLLWAFSLTLCILTSHVGGGSDLQVSAWCSWGAGCRIMLPVVMVAPCQPQPSNRQGLTWLNCWVHNCPLPDLVTFFQGKLRFWNSDRYGHNCHCWLQGRNCVLLRKRGWKKMGKRMKRTHTGLS